MAAPGLVLPDHVQERLRDLIRSAGLRQAAALLGLPASTTARAAGGCGVRRGNLLIIEAALGRLDEAARPPPPPPDQSSAAEG